METSLRSSPRGWGSPGLVMLRGASDLPVPTCRRVLQGAPPAPIVRGTSVGLGPCPCPFPIPTGSLPRSELGAGAEAPAYTTNLRHSLLLRGVGVAWRGPSPWRSGEGVATRSARPSFHDSRFTFHLVPRFTSLPVSPHPAHIPVPGNPPAGGGCLLPCNRAAGHGRRDAGEHHARRAHPAQRERHREDPAPAGVSLTRPPSRRSSRRWTPSPRIRPSGPTRTAPGR